MILKYITKNHETLELNYSIGGFNFEYESGTTPILGKTLLPQPIYNEMTGETEKLYIYTKEKITRIDEYHTQVESDI